VAAGKAELSVVLITCPPEDGARLARLLVEEKLAACVQVLSGAQSYYVWDGAVQEDGEALLILKTDKRHKNRLIEFLTEHHPYDVPELLFLPVTDGHPDYLSWMNSELGGGA